MANTAPARESTQQAAAAAAPPSHDVQNVGLGAIVGLVAAIGGGLLLFGRRGPQPEQQPPPPPQPPPQDELRGGAYAYATPRTASPRRGGAQSPGGGGPAKGAHARRVAALQARAAALEAQRQALLEQERVLAEAAAAEAAAAHAAAAQRPEVTEVAEFMEYYRYDPDAIGLVVGHPDMVAAAAHLLEFAPVAPQRVRNVLAAAATLLGQDAWLRAHAMGPSAPQRLSVAFTHFRLQVRLLEEELRRGAPDGSGALFADEYMATAEPQLLRVGEALMHNLMLDARQDTDAAVGQQWHASGSPLLAHEARRARGAVKRWG